MHKNINNVRVIKYLDSCFMIRKSYFDFIKIDKQFSLTYIKP